MYNSQLTNRQSIRLKRYDYSGDGLYFVTINTKKQQHLFGTIENGEMKLNEGGKMALSCWLEIPKHYPNVVLHNFVVMPNHVHGILEIIKDNTPHFSFQDLQNQELTPFRSPAKTLGSIVRGYKIGVVKWFRSNTDIYDVWHRNYYEIIIRSLPDYERIATYIEDNPKNWKK